MKYGGFRQAKWKAKYWFANKMAHMQNLNVEKLRRVLGKWKKAPCTFRQYKTDSRLSIKSNALLKSSLFLWILYSFILCIAYETCFLMLK